MVMHMARSLSSVCLCCVSAGPHTRLDFTSKGVRSTLQLGFSSWQLHKRRPSLDVQSDLGRGDMTELVCFSPEAELSLNIPSFGIHRLQRPGYDQLLGLPGRVQSRFVVKLCGSEVRQH